MASPVATLIFLIAFVLSMHGLECSRLVAAKHGHAAAQHQLKAKFAAFPAPSGPNPGGNAAVLGSKKNVANAQPSGPNPGGNGITIPDAGLKIVKKMELGGKLPKGNRTPNPGPSKEHNGETMRVVITGKLLKGSTPGSSPSHGHNAVSRIVNVQSKVACTDGLDSPGPGIFGASFFSHN